MTDGQYKFQSLKENERHNAEMERIQRYGTEAQANYTKALQPHAVEKAKQDAKKAKYEASAAYWSFSRAGFDAFGSGVSALRNVGGLFGDVVKTAGSAASMFA